MASDKKLITPDFTLAEPYRELRDRYTQAMYSLSNLVHMDQGEDIGDVVEKVCELVTYQRSIIEALEEGIEVPMEAGGESLYIKIIPTTDEEDDEYE